MTENNDNLPRHDLARAERRFRSRAFVARRTEAEDMAERRRRQNRIVRRVAILVFAVAIAGTWIARKLPDRQPPPAPKVYPWQAGPLFGDEANPPAGSREVDTPNLAPLDGLADGSAGARAAQVSVAEENRWPIEIENSIGMRFRLVPHGSFVMGSPPNERGRGPDEPETVRLVAQPFYLGKFEVTQAQFQQVMGANPSKFRNDHSANFPVEEVTWRDCQAFVEKLCELEELPPWAYRLPTEAEWEYACRAGTQTPFYFGADPERLKEFALFNWNTRQGVETVGRRRPNAWGLYNLHGNVWEWCEDLFYYYDKPTIEDPLRRIIRGGNWYAQPTDCRSASRFRLPPDSHSNLLGFRVVRSLYEPPPKPPKPKEAW